MYTPLLTLFDCARLAANSVAYWRKAVDRGLIRTVHVGRSVRIRPEDFQAFLEAGTTGPGVADTGTVSRNDAT